MSNHEDQVRAFLAQYGIETDDDGYQTSATRCEGCGSSVWVKITQKPAHWESDVYIITFNYKCKHCGSRWEEHDSE